jgi:hypothetical protein
MISSPQCKTIDWPKEVGKYIINDGFHIHMIKKPCWPHRFFTRVFLGWKWEDL